MSRRVAILKHAPPRAKWRYMNMVVELRDALNDGSLQGAEETCKECGKPLGSRPLFMVGKYDICYPCYYAKEREKTT